ncbi:hypothetical protein [Actinokineospora enzanensis]|uniref:hypothetical protein n=1 Tax=Actinokineospora enzanensis TaxID=155975 RepID=UPI00037F19B9|nr:hypothetical protein [Actinokineospora enzanensis]
MTVPPLSADVLTDARDQLARMVRTAPRFIDAVRVWAGFPLHGVRARSATTVPLAEHDAALLDLPTATPVLRREIHLVAKMVGPIFVAASITELVHEPLLGADITARRALRDGPQPTDAILDGLHRAVCLVTRTDSDPGTGTTALIAQTILSGAGRPVALTAEAVHWGLITHRTPDTIPHYATQLPRTSRVAL